VASVCQHGHVPSGAIKRQGTSQQTEGVSAPNKDICCTALPDGMQRNPDDAKHEYLHLQKRDNVQSSRSLSNVAQTMYCRTPNDSNPHSLCLVKLKSHDSKYRNFMSFSYQTRGCSQSMTLIIRNITVVIVNVMIIVLISLLRPLVTTTCLQCVAMKGTLRFYNSDNKLLPV